MKKGLAILFGGRSFEHDISILSAKNIIEAIDQSEYNLVFFAIDKDGNWFKSNEKCRFCEKISLSNAIQSLLSLDLAFPIFHGPFGEDGKIQGFLETIGLPYVGEGVLSSAMCMDKEVAKKMLLEAGLPVAKFVTTTTFIDYEKIAKKLGSTVFIKPCNMGSSIGVTKASNAYEFDEGLKLAFQSDHKVIIEEEIPRT